MAGLHEAVRELDGPVAVDLHESPDHYLIVADLPGATESTTWIDSSTDSLTVRTRRDVGLQRDGTIVRQERPETLEFELPMPDDARADEADASLSRGVLEIRIPRGQSETDIPITGE